MAQPSDVTKAGGTQDLLLPSARLAAEVKSHLVKAFVRGDRVAEALLKARRICCGRITRPGSPTRCSPTAISSWPSSRSEPPGEQHAGNRHRQVSGWRRPGASAAQRWRRRVFSDVSWHPHQTKGDIRLAYRHSRVASCTTSSTSRSLGVTAGRCITTALVAANHRKCDTTGRAIDRPRLSRVTFR